MIIFSTPMFIKVQSIVVTLAGILISDIFVHPHKNLPSIVSKSSFNIHSVRLMQSMKVSLMILTPLGKDTFSKLTQPENVPLHFSPQITNSSGKVTFFRLPHPANDISPSNASTVFGITISSKFEHPPKNHLQ